MDDLITNIDGITESDIQTTQQPVVIPDAIRRLSLVVDEIHSLSEAITEIKLCSKIDAAKVEQVRKLIDQIYAKTTEENAKSDLDYIKNYLNLDDTNKANLTTVAEMKDNIATVVSMQTDIKSILETDNLDAIKGIMDNTVSYGGTTMSVKEALVGVASIKDNIFSITSNEMIEKFSAISTYLNYIRDVLLKDNMDAIKAVSKITSNVVTTSIMKPNIDKVVGMKTSIDTLLNDENLKPIKNVNDNLEHINAVNTSLEQINKLAEEENIASIKNVNNNVKVITNINNSIGSINKLAKEGNTKAILNINDNLEALNRIDNVLTKGGGYYTKSETNAKLLTKVDTITLNDYTNTEGMNAALKNKVDKTTLSSYYTKTEVDTQHSTLVKDIYNKAEIAGLLSKKVDVSTLESNYTNNVNLKKQLLEKVDKTILDAQTTKHNNDVIKLTTAMEEVSDELTKQVSGLEELANKFTSVIPTKASATNQLTDKEYVDNAIKNAAARAISADADGNGFTSVAALKAGPWFSLGEPTTPTTNDYAVVKKDATHNNNDVRYNYDGKVWAFFQEFTSGNNVTFTTSQQLAIDSGITSAKVTEIQTNANNIAAETTARIKGDADLAAEVERKVKEASNLIGDLSTLNTDVNTSIVECINDLHDELHNERLATDGSNKMTGQLDIVLAGSGDLLLLKAGDKGVNFNLDSATGYMNIIPESAPTTGFELSAVSIKPRTSTYPYSLGDNNNAFTNAFIKNINNTPVSSFLTTADVTKEEIAKIKADIETNRTDIANRVLKTGDEMSGTLKVTLPGSGDLIHMESGGKGVTFSMDASTGYMNIIPVSAPSTGFEVSAFALEPRTTTIPYRLGNKGNEWTTMWVKNINDIAVTDIAKKSDLDAIKYFAVNTTGAITFTQAEYDALSDEKKNNGKMYIIVE